MTEDFVVVNLPTKFVEQLIKPWYLIKQWDAEEIRNICRQALGEKNESTS